MKVVKIGAVWCPGCLIMRPRWAKLEKKFPWLKTEYYDFDQDADKIRSFKVESGKLPVFIFLDKNGREITRISGEPSEEKLTQLILKYKNR